MLGRDSPTFLGPGDALPGPPDLPSLLGQGALPLPTGPDPLLAARMQGLACFNPMMHAFQHGFQGLSALQLQHKAAFNSLATSSGYILHPQNPHISSPLAAAAPFMAAAAAAVSSPAATFPGSHLMSLTNQRRLNLENSDSLDLRKSSIDTLRMKAKEHAVEVDVPNGSHSPDVKS